MPTRAPHRRRVLRAAKRGLRAATRPVIRDARGRTVTLFNSRKRLWRDPSGLEFSQTDFRRVLERLERDLHPRGGSSPSSRSIPALRRIFVLCSIAFAALFGAAFLSGIMNAPSGPQRIAITIIFVLTLSGIIVAQIYRRCEHARTFPPTATEIQIVAAMLSEERCPSCAYHIGRVDPEADGCTVCPECGGAWHVDRVRPVFTMG